MQTDEKRTIYQIMKHSFPVVQRWFFSWTPHVLVAERDGQLLGATVLKLIPLPHNRQGGLIYWVFTTQEIRGLKGGSGLPLTLDT